MKANSEVIDGKNISKDFFDICNLKRHQGRIGCICNLNNGYFASGGADDKTNVDHNIYIWKSTEYKYELGQIMVNVHDSDINSIILLRDGRFATTSKDRTIKIWSINNSIINEKIEFVLNQVLNDYNHGLYKLIQLADDRLVATASDNNMIFWNSNQGIF